MVDFPVAMLPVRARRSMILLGDGEKGGRRKWVEIKEGERYVVDV